MKQLNPDRNYYSVAPIGPIVVIGRQMTLKGGIVREKAINLIAWLTIATNASMEEVRAEIEAAYTPLPKAVVTPDAVIAPTGEVARFVGDVDAEEAAAIAEAVTKAGEALRNGS